MAVQMSYIEPIKFGYAKFKESWKILLGYFFFLIVLQAVLTGISGFLDEGILGFIWGLITFGISILTSLAGIVLSLRIVDGQDLGLPALKEAVLSKTDRIVPLFIGQMLISLLIVLGLVLLVIPGIYLLLRYMFAQYVYVDEKVGVKEGMRRASEMTQGKKLWLLVFGIIITLLNVAGALALLVGLLITAPVSFIAMAYIYRQFAGGTVAHADGQGKNSRVRPDVQPELQPAATFQPEHQAGVSEYQPS